MKTSIGIRATPSIVYFSVVKTIDSEVIEIEAIDKIIIPKALDTPEQLKYIRNTLSDIIHEFHITNACIRVTESNARSMSIPRVYIEGVVQELFASSSIEKYYIGQISNISSKLNIDRKNFNDYSEGHEVFLNINNWIKYKKEERESIMSAISSLEI